MSESPVVTQVEESSCRNHHREGCENQSSPVRSQPSGYLTSQKAFLAILSVLLLGQSTTLAPSVAGPQQVSISGEIPSVFEKTYPTALEDLRQIESHVASLIEKVKPVTVGVRVGRAFGSGVIVSNDGYVLTAGHVSGEPNQRAEVILSDGRKYSAVTLGRNTTFDSGLIKIDTKRKDWPHALMESRDDCDTGDWCAALGHPGGVQQGRDAVLRLGRVLHIGDHLVRTDCELVGGDSGGPLFDMWGRVIGINSRIAEQADMNFHVPVSLYVDEWDRLAAGESFYSHSGAHLGVKGDRGPDGFGLLVTSVGEGSAAEKAGLKVDDLIIRFEGERVNSIEDLKDLVGMYPPGSQVAISIFREGRAVTIRPRLGSK